MDRVCLDRDPVIITRNRDQAVVMISLDDYQSLQETARVLLVVGRLAMIEEVVHEIAHIGAIMREISDRAPDQDVQEGLEVVSDVHLFRRYVQGIHGHKLPRTLMRRDIKVSVDSKHTDQLHTVRSG